ncbi:hypothetical protein ACFLS7_01525 [Bacteroidota bacterium]
MKKQTFLLISAILFIGAINFEKNVDPRENHEKATSAAPTLHLCLKCPMMTPKVPLDNSFDVMVGFVDHSVLSPVVTQEADFNDFNFNN